MISRSQNVLVIIIISSWVTEQSFSLETEMLFLFPLPENPATFKAYFSLMWRKILKNKTGYAYYLALPFLHPYEGDPLKLYHDPKSERKKDTLACLNSTVCIAYMRSNPPPNPPTPRPTPTLASPFSFFLRVTSSFNPSFTGYSTIEIFIRTIMPVVIIFFVTLYSCKGRTTPNRYKGNLELDSADSVQLSDITLWLSIRQTVLPKGDTYGSNGVPLRADYVQLTLSKTDTFGTSTMCPS